MGWLKLHLLVVVLLANNIAFAQAYNTLNDINYYQPSSLITADSLVKQSCVLDLYYPTDITGFPTLIWIHGGGLTGGQKYIPSYLKNKKIAVVAVEYRLSPAVPALVAIEDVAAAVAWVFNNIEDFGGNPDAIFVGGHSAGGYLASMVGLDTAYLSKHSISANRIAGIISLSGHAITHFTVRAERGIEKTQPVVDRYAPLFHVRADAAPYLMITGDRNLEMLGRYEENAYMVRMMKVAGHPSTILYELQGYGHNIVAAAMPIVLNFINE